MNYHESVVKWFSRFSCIALAVALVCVAGIASAQDVINVEEDWELVLGQPDPNLCGPQIAVAMSPYSHIQSTYFTFEINHRSAPYWTAGGLSMHQWDGERRVQSYDRTDRTVMNTAEEVVTWTQRMYIDNGLLGLGLGSKLYYEVKNGHSTTWGDFGTSGMFKVRMDWNRNDLNDYSPAVTIAESGVTYAGNRVKSLKIKKIRLTLSDGSELEDDTVRVAHQLVE
jgi:hypothetical protein